MPELARLVREGQRGVLETEHPPLSPLLWTTMMTGTGPIEHGVLDFVRFQPGTGEREPIGSEERTRPAIWNMATWGGKKVGLFGLWATYPAEAGRRRAGLGPPVRVPQPRGPAARGRGLPARAPDLGDRGAATHRAKRSTPPSCAASCPGSTAADFAARARPRGGERPYDDPVVGAASDPDRDPGLRRALPLVRRRVAPRPRDPLSAGHRHRSAICSLPTWRRELPAISAQDFERFRDVPALYFQWLDGLLGRYREMAARDGAALFFASDHGFLWQEGRPTSSRASTCRPPPSGTARKACTCSGEFPPRR